MSISTSELDALLRGIQRAAPDRKAARLSLDTAAALDRPLWIALSEMGIPGAPLPETLGGSSLGLSEQVAIVEALARMVAPVPIASAFLAAHILGRGVASAERYAGDLASGSAVVGACLSASTSLPQGLDLSADQKFSGEIADVMDGNAIDTLLIWHDGMWRAVDMHSAGIERRALRTLDPTHALCTIRFDNAASIAISAADPSEVMALAWVLMASEALGAAQVAMDMASRYALDRRQFGQQIGRFQAIKHKLANMLVAVEGARSAVLGAARGVGTGVPDLRLARMAKLLAGAAGVEVVGESIQIHGAIGCTWEHDLHLLLRRAKYCQLALQSDQQHLAVLADELLADARKADKPKKRSIKKEFDLDQADMDFSDELRAWLDAHATREKIAELRGRDIGVLRAWQGELADARWAGIHWPKRFGGRDATFKQQVLYHSELAARGLPTLIGNRALSLIGPTLIVHGTPEQQAFFLEPSRRADFLWASGMSEPGSGSDLASLRTRGEIDGADLVINGQKIWTSGAHRSEWLYTLVRTGALVPKHEGITCILIPLSSKGLTIRPIKRMNGVPEFNEIFFDNVRVPLRNVMGDIGEGWRVARTTLAHEHMTNFLGAQLRQVYFVDRIITQLAEREIREGTLDHSLRQRVGQAWINTQLLRLHGLRNMTQIVEGHEPGAEGSILKLFGQEEERRLYELAVDVRGASGLTSDSSGRGYLGARAATIGGGTSEIHRNKIAERVLGMPRDPWADD